MDYRRIAKIYNYVFSTPRNSPERTTRLEVLSEADREALFDYSNGILSGRIKQNKTEVEEMADGTKTYEWYKKKREFNENGDMRELSKFCFDNPGLYDEYRNRYEAEQSEEMRLHNRRLTENTHKNKQYKG